MKCEDINELLAAYLDKEVTPDKERQVQAHLSTCQRCQEEVKTLTATQEGLRQALRLRAAEASPSPQVWERLHQRLEATPRSSFVGRWSNWLSEPVWRTAIPIVLVLIVIGALWGTGVLPGFQGGQVTTPTVPAVPTTPTPPGVTLAPVPSGLVEFDRIPDTTYQYGEQIELELSFTNRASEPRIMSPFPPEIKIIKLPDVEPPDIIIRSFSPDTKDLELAAGESVSYFLIWDQKDNSGQQVLPGWYKVKMTVASRKVSEATTGQIGGSTRVLILPPEGVMEKTIDVNRSVTVNGITITLERVELTATGMKVYAFSTAPGYSALQEMQPAPKFIISAFAEYSIDGGPLKQALPSVLPFLENGMLHTWGEYLDPVPKNAKELTFRVTKLSGVRLPAQDWQGPWEFEVPLQ